MDQGAKEESYNFLTELRLIAISLALGPLPSASSISVLLLRVDQTIDIIMVQVATILFIRSQVGKFP